MSNLFFSVIIAVYNVERYLEDCLDSISNQSYENFEIIAVDDCSTDKSLSILKDCRDDRLKIYEHESNKGQGAARNLGITKASGKYIVFVDSDDMIRLDTLQKLHDGFTTTNVNYIRFNAQSFIDGDMKPFIEKKYNFGTYLKNNKVYQKGNLNDIYYSFTASPVLQSFSTKLLRDNSLLFHESIIHEDELFNTFLTLSIEKCLFIDEPFYYRRYRENSTMTNKTKTQIRKSFNSYVQILDIYEEKLRDSSLTRYKKRFLKYRINSVLNNLRTKTNYKLLEIPHMNYNFKEYYHKNWVKNIYRIKKIMIILRRKLNLYL